MTSLSDRLERVLHAALPALRAIPDDLAAAPLAPGKWSRAQVLGHLIDSAANNHARFVRLALGDEGAMPGYAQDAWVAVQGYATAPFPELVAHFAAYNRHLARVLRGLPADAFARRASIAGDPPTTLAILAEGYVAHLEHHLGQVLGLGDSRVLGR